MIPILRIKIFETSTVIEHNTGVRDHYEYKDAAFADSLFLDYLLENGLDVWHGKSTRDIICLEFNYGTRSYADESEHLKKLSKTARREYRVARLKGDAVAIEKATAKREKISSLMEEAYRNRRYYQKMTTDKLRELVYKDGIDITYEGRRGKKTLHYVMLFRSTGKAKKGSCIFIRKPLYKKAINFLRMGIKLPKKNAPIVEVSAYSSLVASGIVGRIKIDPRNILVLKDVDRFCRREVISVETDENKQCISRRLPDFELKNTLFDGQALIDTKLFKDWRADDGDKGNGYLLLRHHFCKMAAFEADIQGFFKDYCAEHGLDYETATVKDYWGNVHYLKDLELVTTDQAMKWMKFPVTYDDWCEWVNANDNNFGVVKTAHRSKLGSVQRMSYQMVNTLDEEVMPDVVKESLDYVARLKLDDLEFFKYLKRNSTFANDYEVLLALCEQDSDFARSTYFRERRNKIIERYIYRLKAGEIIQDADNLVIVGSPYAMLLYAATGDEKSCDLDDTFSVESDAIQCYTPRFAEGTYLAGFRSPFNSRNNMDYMHNVYDDRLKKYFGFTGQIIAVNMIGTDFQDRNNGSDQDSDSLYVTAQPAIVGCARRFYYEYPTIVNQIPKDKNVYNNTPSDFARLDNTLAKSQLAIGLSSNLAQLAQSYSYTFKDEKYQMFTCVLSVLAQVAIDNSKRRYDLDIDKAISAIKDAMDIKTNGYPFFWKVIKSDSVYYHINRDIHCPMNYLAELKFPKLRKRGLSMPIDVFIRRFSPDKDKRRSVKVEHLIAHYAFHIYNIRDNGDEMDAGGLFIIRSDFEQLIEDIRRTYISHSYVALMSWLIERAFNVTPSLAKKAHVKKSVLQNNRALLLKTLYEVNKKDFLLCFSGNVKEEQ